MKIKNFLLTFLICLIIVFGFFYKTIVYKDMPFPGDLLISEYNPWKTYSYLGYNPGSYPSKVQYFDVIRQLYPWKTFSLASLKIGKLPLWNPYNFSGAPLLANVQSAVFYPLNVLYLFLSQVSAWSMLVFLQSLLAAFFTILYSRKIGLSLIASFFAGISFAFSSFLTVWLEYNTIDQVILWLPLVLLSIENLLEKKTANSIFLIIFAFLASLLGGHIQVFAYSFLFSAIYCFVRGGKSLFFFVLFLLPIGLGAIQLFPTLELIRESARSSHSYESFIDKILIQPWQLIMMFVPDFFGNPATHNYFPKDTYVGKVTSIGLVPLFFVVQVFLNKKNKYIKFFLFSAIIVLLSVTLNPITYFFYKIHIPFISDSAPTLSIFILCFSLSMLCGFGVDLWQPSKTWRKEKSFYFLILFAFLWLALFFIPKQFFLVSFRNLTYSTVLLLISLVFFLIPTFYKKSRMIILICLLFVATFDQWRSFQKFNPFSPKDIIFPNAPIIEFIKGNSGINRFWGYGSALIDANFATQFSLFSPDGYDPLYPKRYGEFIQASKEGKISTQFTDQTRSDATIDRGEINSSKLKVLDLLGVKYVLDKDENASTEKIFPIDRFSLIYQKDGWKIFENNKSLPRILLIGNYELFSNKNDFENIFFGHNFDPEKAVLLEESPVGFENIKSDSFNDLKLISYLSSEISIDVNTDKNKLLFLSDTYYPGWEAYVDEKETKIYRANYAFRAIVVPQGRHVVKFLYNPLSFRIGYYTSLLSVGLLVMFLAIKKK